MIKTINISIAAFLLISTIISSCYAQNLVKNGSFESGDLGGWTLNSPRTSIDINKDYGSTNGMFALNFSYSDSGGADLQQNISTEVGNTYLVEFDWKSSHPKPQKLLFHVVGVSGKLMESTISGVGSSPFEAKSPFKHYSTTFIADGAFAILRFIDSSESSFQVNQVIDNVIVTKCITSECLEVVKARLAAEAHEAREAQKRIAREEAYKKSPAGHAEERLRKVREAAEAREGQKRVPPSAAAAEVRFLAKGIVCNTKEDLLSVVKTINDPEWLAAKMSMSSCMYGKDLKKRLGKDTANAAVAYENTPQGVIARLSDSSGTAVYVLKEHIEVNNSNSSQSSQYSVTRRDISSLGFLQLWGRCGNGKDFFVTQDDSKHYPWSAFGKSGWYVTSDEAIRRACGE